MNTHTPKKKKISGIATVQMKGDFLHALICQCRCTLENILKMTFMRKAVKPEFFY